jgi:hypothetical protein
MESIRDNIRSLEFDPENKKAHYRLAKSLVALKQYNWAKRVYELYLRRYPGDLSLDSVGKVLQKGKGGLFSICIYTVSNFFAIFRCFLAFFTLKKL